MLTGAVQRHSWVLKIIQPILIGFLALATALVVSVRTELSFLLVEVLLLVIVMVVSKAEVPKPIVAYIVADHLCQFF